MPAPPCAVEEIKRKIPHLYFHPNARSVRWGPRFASWRKRWLVDEVRDDDSWLFGENSLMLHLLGKHSRGPSLRAHRKAARTCSGWQR